MPVGACDIHVRATYAITLPTYWAFRIPLGLSTYVVTAPDAHG